MDRKMSQVAYFESFERKLGVKDGFGEYFGGFGTFFLFEIRLKALFHFWGGASWPRKVVPGAPPERHAEPKIDPETSEIESKRR